ncbi:Cof-type HAD-IIB family hydrolase [Prevotella sp. AGR2160]|uniref:Cof-type HAD-IIB family hydrolase n=1 Tax=Prevotella sp. AGR2160 TaxID=1280674 RepID=UPI00040375D4|nr:Cof-type HAD-IIB family hydrolase [Prevotella sp. AGR2160]
MKQYKMIVLDLDGTLTNEKKEITPRTLAALMEAQTVGVTVVLASGRPTYGIMPLAKQLKLSKYDGYILAYNGGKITRPKTGEVIFNQSLNPQYVPLLYHAAMDAGMEILTYQGEGIAATKKENKYVLHEAFINKMPVKQYDDFLHQVQYPINKCLIVGDPKPLHELEQKLTMELRGKMEVYRSAGFFLECVPLGIEKSNAIDMLAHTLGIDRSEIIAVGDGYNDKSMIEYAGLGVAMANASTEVQDAADYITYSNEEDGVAHVVDKFILKKESRPDFVSNHREEEEEEEEDLEE